MSISCKTRFSKRKIAIDQDIQFMFDNAEGMEPKPRPYYAAYVETYFNLPAHVACPPDIDMNDDSVEVDLYVQYAPPMPAIGFPGEMLRGLYIIKAPERHISGEFRFTEKEKDTLRTAIREVIIAEEKRSPEAALAEFYNEERRQYESASANKE